jgi:hypothetical protein
MPLKWEYAGDCGVGANKASDALSTELSGLGHGPAHGPTCENDHRAVSCQCRCVTRRCQGCLGDPERPLVAMQLHIFLYFRPSTWQSRRVERIQMPP